MRCRISVSVVSVLLLLILAIFPSGFAAAGPKPYQEAPIHISTYGVGSSAYMSMAMAAEGITEYTGQKFRLLPGGTDVARMSALRAEAVSFISTGGGGVFASAGKADFSAISWGPQDLRIVWCPAITGIVMFVRGDSDIKQLADLKGKKVSYTEGSPGLNVQVTASLAFGGLTWDDVKMVKLPSYGKGCEAVISGLVDAMITVPTSSYVYRLESSKHGLRYLPAPHDDEEGWKRARAVFPFWAKYTAVTGAGVSKDKPLQCGTYANPILLTMADQNPDLVYWMAKNLAEAYPIFSKKADIMKTNWTLDWTLKLIASTAIPAHPGVIRYLKEIAKWTPELELHNRGLLQNKKALIDLWKQALASAGEKKIKDKDFPDFWEKMRLEGGPKYAW